MQDPVPGSAGINPLRVHVRFDNSSAIASFTNCRCAIASAPVERRYFQSPRLGDGPLPDPRKPLIRPTSSW